MNELREKLAELEHQRWSSWQKWCHEVLRRECPSEALEKVLARWDRQIATDYKDLSEKEKDSDRAEADKTIGLLMNFGKPPVYKLDVNTSKCNLCVHKGSLQCAECFNHGWFTMLPQPSEFALPVKILLDPLPVIADRKGYWVNVNSNGYVWRMFCGPKDTSKPMADDIAFEGKSYEDVEVKMREHLESLPDRGQDDGNKNG